VEFQFAGIEADDAAVTVAVQGFDPAQTIVSGEVPLVRAIPRLDATGLMVALTIPRDLVLSNSTGTVLGVIELAAV
jgi:hypothetical protein